MSTRLRSKSKSLVVVQMGDLLACVREPRGDFQGLIAQAIGGAWDGTYEVVDPRPSGAAFPAPEAAAAFVITGSASSVTERAPWMVRAEAWLRSVVRLRTPTFGICFGHQILAQALGGDVQRNPRGREMGTVSIERLDDDPILEGLPAHFVVNATHVDTVARTPPGAVPLARSVLENHQALRFGEACYGVQFHPEIDAEVMRAYVEARRELLMTEGFEVDRMLAAIEDTEASRRVLQNFVRCFV